MSVNCILKSQSYEKKSIYRSDEEAENCFYEYTKDNEMKKGTGAQFQNRCKWLVIMLGMDVFTQITVVFNHC